MQYLKRAIYGPDPKEQKRKCDAAIRKNQREIERQIASLRSSETKTKQFIRQCATRGDMASTKLLAREVARSQNHRERLYKSKAQLNSIKMQVADSFALQKIQGSMAQSTSVMRQVNHLIRLPELMGTMNMLGQELMKAGIIDEMVTDGLDTLEDEEADSELEEQQQKVLDDILAPPRKTGAERVPQPAKELPEEQAISEPEDEQGEIEGMRERLRALQS